ncbi:MAG: hypothetical protein WCG91_01865 [Candidatus Shapirobacteria bacterium]
MANKEMESLLNNLSEIECVYSRKDGIFGNNPHFFVRLNSEQHKKRFSGVDGDELEKERINLIENWKEHSEAAEFKKLPDGTVCKLSEREIEHRQLIKIKLEKRK